MSLEILIKVEDFIKQRGRGSTIDQMIQVSYLTLSCRVDMNMDFSRSYYRNLVPAHAICLIFRFKSNIKLLLTSP